MARIKHVKRARPQAASPDESHAEDTTPAPPPRKRGRPRCSPTETDESHADNTTSVARPKRGRPHRVAADTVQPVAPLTKHKAAPAAFPSLSYEQPLHVDVYLHHGLKQRVDASTDKDLEKCSEDMNAIYDNRCFPKHMNNEQRAWYEELKGRWLPDHVPVRKIAFANLYYSLRATIIEQIRDDFPRCYRLDRYDLVKEILNLNDFDLSRIMNENNKAWDEIPLHLAKLKKEHPDEPINPNLPPPHRLVEAIRFLKEEDLPGSLLGEWQFPLPHVEAFLPQLFPSEGESEEIYPEEPFAIQDAVNEEPSDDFFTDQWDIDGGLPFPSGGYNFLSDLDIRHAGSAAIYDIGRTLAPGNDDDQRAEQPAAPAHIISPESMKRYLHNPTQALSLAVRAKMDAERLWVQHRSNTVDLTTAPPFMAQPRTTVYEKAIALELAVFWRNTISSKMLKANTMHTQNMFTEKHKRLRQWENRLEHEIQVMHAELTRFEKEKTGHPANISAAPKRTEATGPPRNAPKKPNKPPTAPRARPARPAAREHNAGFGESTKIIFFRAPEASMTGPERPVENATQQGIKKHDQATNNAVQPAHIPEPTYELASGTVHTAPTQPHPSVKPYTSHPHPSGKPPMPTPSHPHSSVQLPTSHRHLDSQYAASSLYMPAGPVSAGHVSRYTNNPHRQVPHPDALNGHGQIVPPASQNYSAHTFGGGMPIPMPRVNKSMKIEEMSGKVCNEGGEVVDSPDL